MSRRCDDCGSFMKRHAVNCKQCLRVERSPDSQPVPSLRAMPPAPSIPVLDQAAPVRPYSTVRGWVEKRDRERRAAISC